MLSIEHLNKRFGSLSAVTDLNLYIQKGELFGFVGHNGAGKTTTMKIVCGLMKATSGQIRIDGVDAFTDRMQIKRKIGYMPDFFGVYDNLKAIEYMDFYAAMYGLIGQAARDRCWELLDLVNLSDKGEAYVDHLSRGMKQRLCLARTLVHDPNLLLLDEPASGLDPRARYEMKEIIKNLGSMGKTAVISSHILPELADMCTSIGIMQNGRLLLKGTMEEIELQAMYARPLHILLLEGLEDAWKIVRRDPKCRKAQIRDQEIIADYAGSEAETAQLLKHLVEGGVAVQSFYQEKGNLESLFMELTSEEGQRLYAEEQGGEAV